MKTSNLYSNNQAVSLAKKIKVLSYYEVPYDISLVKGIAGEDVVKLEWDDEVLEEKMYWDDVERDMEVR